MIWTGSEVIVWGGCINGGVQYSNTGGRYNPNTDGWTTTNTINAPDARGGHTAIWTGSEMIVWGGYLMYGQGVDTGGRYDPSTDSWTQTSTINAPVARFNQAGVWSRSEMIVWGGTNNEGNNEFNTGGRYCAQSGPTPTPSPTATPSSTPRPTPTPRPRPSRRLALKFELK